MVITGGVAGVLYIYGVFVNLFGLSAGEVSFALLRYNIGDKSLLGLEVVTHGLGLVSGAVVVKYWRALEVADRVDRADSIDCGRVKIHFDLVGVEFDTSICHFAVAIHVGPVLAGHHHRVFGREVNGIVEVDLCTYDL